MSLVYEKLTRFLEEINKRVIEKFQPEKIYVFGSYGKGTTHEDSDLDILIIFNEIIDKRKKILEIRRILSDLPVSKDIIIATFEELKEYENKKWSIYYHAIKEGKIVYERKAA